MKPPGSNSWGVVRKYTCPQSESFWVGGPEVNDYIPVGSLVAFCETFHAKSLLQVEDLMS